MAYSFRFLWDSFKYPLPWLESIINEEQPFSKNYFYGEILHISDSITNISINF